MEITARPTVTAFGKSLCFLAIMLCIAYLNTDPTASPLIWVTILGLGFMLFMKTRFTSYKVTSDQILVKSFGAGDKRILRRAIQSTEFKPKGIRAGTLILRTASDKIELHNLSLKKARLIESALM